MRLLDLPGSHSIFDTIGSSHECGQYHFEVNDGNVRWFHRNETQSTVFSVEATGGLVKQGSNIFYPACMCTHLASKLTCSTLCNVIYKGHFICYIS